MSEEKQETIADIVTEMRKRAEEVYVGQYGYPESWKNQMDYGEIYELADRIEAALKREREATSEKSSAVGNAAAMREALLRCDAIAQMPEIREYVIVKDMRNLIKKALSAPPRNCDVGTPEEQSARFDTHCRKHMGCMTCPLREKDGGVPKHCEFAWSQMPYEEVKK